MVLITHECGSNKCTGSWVQFLCNGLEEDFAMKRHAVGSAGSELDLLVQSSGKMLLLHKLLPKLKDEGHKVSLVSCLSLDLVML